MQYPTRRSFIKAAAMMAAAPFILPSRLRAQGSSPGQKITLGCIGMGKVMGGHLERLLQREEVQIVAVCDVDTTRREHYRDLVDRTYAEAAGLSAGAKVCTSYNDFRELLTRADIDAVIIATPDHWHAIIAIAAMRAGKDVYCEKPLAYNIHESLALVKATRETKRVLQTGSQQRSMSEFRMAAELVRNGIIGKISSIDVHFGNPAVKYALPEEPMEAGLDWKMWCGPGPLVNYNTDLSPRGLPKGFPEWRRTREFGGGDITDWGAHQIDIAQWALGFDGSGPVEIRAPSYWQDAKMGSRLVYANGTVITHRNSTHVRRGLSIYGADGEIHVFRRQFEMVYRNKPFQRFINQDIDKNTSLDRVLALTNREFLADAKFKFPKISDHFGNFFDCVKSRQTPICDVVIGASSVIACHLMNFGYYYGANAKWDPAKSQFISGGDAKWLTREQYTPGWEVV
jgi:predicted dehydrogenase